MDSNGSISVRNRETRILLVTVFLSCLASGFVVSQANAAVTSANSNGMNAEIGADPLANDDDHLLRIFSFFTLRPGVTEEDIRHRSVDKQHSDRFMGKHSEYLKRYSQNFILGVPTGNQPGFRFFEEFASPSGGLKAMRSRAPKEVLHTFDRVTFGHFTRHILFGSPVIDKSEPYPTRKRAIFLRRTEKASPQVVTSELLGFARSAVEQVKGISRRVVLYTMAGDQRNYPSIDYPADRKQPRKFDAILMIWPNGHSIIPDQLRSGPPSNYHILYTVNIDAYYSSPIR